MDVCLQSAAVVQLEHGLVLRLFMSCPSHTGLFMRWSYNYGQNWRGFAL